MCALRIEQLSSTLDRIVVCAHSEGKICSCSEESFKFCYGKIAKQVNWWCSCCLISFCSFMPNKQLVVLVYIMNFEVLWVRWLTIRGPRTPDSKLIFLFRTCNYIFKFAIIFYRLTISLFRYIPSGISSRPILLTAHGLRLLRYPQLRG